MSSGTELFNNYDSDFQLVYSEINQKLEELPEQGGQQQRKTTVKAVERAIDEAYEILDQMSVEVQNIASSERGQFNARLREYRSNVDRAKQNLKSAAEQADRQALFGSAAERDGGQTSDDIALDQRQQLLSGTASLDRSSQRLRDSQRVANETEGIGANILADLRGQREQITNSRNTLMEADSYVDKSIRTLRGMARRMATNRIITVAIITILIILIFLVIASKFW
ncbi:hypothetical protein TRICI_003603 [Trichomonascus ciferrii]|uniref:t-SNARE coiled-coil homology domain-containing protein n=1 Tax=Trichomonascus ciferrii TaxID=44093 RepID=A0A642V9L6_9ASCO|nr:hypothetical protein TRICI_003603 [Trichomonascus ciferrii]